MLWNFWRFKMISTISKAEFCILQNQRSIPSNGWKWLLSANKEEIDAEFEYCTQEEEFNNDK